MNRVLGAVLAGGRSSRFGSDKARALFAGERLVDRARQLISPWCATTIIIGGEEGIEDLPAPGLGPLGGIAAALDRGASDGFDGVLTIGCDMPVVPTALIDALVRAGKAYCADAPILACWPTALGAQLLSHIATAPDRSVRRWAASIGALPIAAPQPLANVNTPDDLLAL